MKCIKLSNGAIHAPDYVMLLFTPQTLLDYCKELAGQVTNWIIPVELVDTEDGPMVEFHPDTEVPADILNQLDKIDMPYDDVLLNDWILEKMLGTKDFITSLWFELERGELISVYIKREVYDALGGN